MKVVDVNMIYRLAKLSDIHDIALLVTKLLGTCNIDKNINNKEIDIINKNEEEIKKNINNYYVCIDNNKIVGACGISELKNKNSYNIEIKNYREILYLVVDNNYQKKGIGTELLKLCCNNNEYPILYEAWGDKEEVNSKALLERLSFVLLKDLGDTYYKDNGYCSYCVNRNKTCDKCKAQLWIKR